MASFGEIPPFAAHGVSEWRLCGALVYNSDLAGRIVVPEGFVTDLASIPQIFQALLPQNDRHRLAAVVHDYLCRLEGFDRRMADRVFLEAMKVLEVQVWKRWSMFLAVALMTTWFRLKGEK